MCAINISYLHSTFRSETAGFPYTCLLRHTYEGNNIPEAVDICNCLDSWLGLLDVSIASYYLYILVLLSYV